MKLTLSIFVFLLITTNSFGQRIKFSDTGNQWYVLRAQAGPGTTPVTYTTYTYGRDSVFGGNTYRQLLGGYVREDTMAKKVYYRYVNGIKIDTADRLLYDYNWVVGDTLNVHDDFLFSQNTTFKIFRIDSTKIAGLWYKVWHFEGGLESHPISTQYHYNIIEGIGCTNGFSYPLAPNFEDETSMMLLCFNHNGTHPILSNPVTAWGLWERSTISFDNNISCTLSEAQILKINEAISIVPNPITESSRLVLPTTITSGSLVIYNNVGQVIVNTTFQNKQELLIGDKIIVPGIYFYRVTNFEHGVTLSGKFEQL